MVGYLLLIPIRLLVRMLRFACYMVVCIILQFVVLLLLGLLILGLIKGWCGM